MSDPGPGSFVWHDIECGAYRADLALWRKLATRSAPSGSSAGVLDIGCGTGRVSLDLARRGHALTALDRDPALLAALEQRASQARIEVKTVVGDARELDLGVEFDLVLAPMQFVQLLGGGAQRQGFLERVVRHLRPGGLFAAALMDLGDEPIDSDYRAPLPDTGEADGWACSSLPVAIRTRDRGRSVVLERLRSAVSSAGDVLEHRDSVSLRLVPADQLERECERAGLINAVRREIGATADHVGSVVCVLERP
ncbi:MAG: class I SAM-dependent methyltransferase [Solirubrobacterales bacterium]